MANSTHLMRFSLAVLELQLWNFFPFQASKVAKFFTIALFHGQVIIILSSTAYCCYRKEY